MRLTHGVYTDLRLLDLRAGVNRIQDVPIDDTDTRGLLRKTGTDDASGLCAALALNLDQTRQSGATSGNTAVRDILATLGVTSDGDGLHSAPSDQSGKRVKGIEPSTFSLGSGSPPQTSDESTQLTEGGIARAAPTTATDAHLEALLAAWPQLSEEMRAAVRAMVEAAV